MIRVRFAANPTGHVFVNSARVALANWLFARHMSGVCILRLDDAGQAPGKPDFTRAIEHDLGWLGLTWDETTRQSERQTALDAAIEALRAAKRLYPCFESDEELHAKSERRRRQNRADIYDRAMLTLTPTQRATAEAGGKRPYWRFRLSDSLLRWSDSILGRREAKLSAISDPILIRADGAVSPLLASAVDDIALKITHAIRAEDNATNTAIYLDLRASLPNGGAPLRLASVPALGGGKSGARPLRDLRADGIVPAALIAWLSGAGGTLENPLDGFDLARLRPDPAPATLLAFNRARLGAMAFAAARDWLPPDATEAFWAAVRGGIDLPRDAATWWDIATGVPPPPTEPNPVAGAALAALPAEPWDGDTWAGWVAATAARAGLSEGAVSAGLFLALTGEDSGPNIAALLPIMGVRRAEARLRASMG